VSIWLDDLSRERLTSGSLAELVARDHVTGVTTNPTIFAKAISDGDTYAAQLADLSARGVSVGEALRALTTFDVRWACDVLGPVYDATNGVDGRVSIEVDPRLPATTPPPPSKRRTRRQNRRHCRRAPRDHRTHRRWIQCQRDIVLLLAALPRGDDAYLTGLARAVARCP